MKISCPAYRRSFFTLFVLLIATCLDGDTPVTDAFQTSVARNQHVAEPSRCFVSSLVSSTLRLHPDQGKDLEAYANELFTNIKREKDRHNDEYNMVQAQRHHHQLVRTSTTECPSTNGPLAWCKKRVVSGWKRTTTASRITLNGKMPWAPTERAASFSFCRVKKKAPGIYICGSLRVWNFGWVATLVDELLLFVWLEVLFRLPILSPPPNADDINFFYVKITKKMRRDLPSINHSVVLVVMFRVNHGSFFQKR